MLGRQLLSNILPKICKSNKSRVLKWNASLWLTAYQEQSELWKLAWTFC